MLQMLTLLLSCLLFTSTSFASNSKAGKSIPLLSFPWKNAQASDTVYKMTDYPNGVFVFETYRLSCGYCNENAALVNKITTEYANEPRVQILDLSLDTVGSDFAEWIRRHKPNHPVIQDTDRKVYNALKLQSGVPQVFVVDCKGNMVGGHVGTWDDGGRYVKSLITKALQVSCQ